MTAESDSSFQNLAAATRNLFASVRRLHDQSKILQPVPLEQHEWFESLRQKLIPQLGEDAWLVAAVVGGTNIGKSVTFNHLAGNQASATSPLASGTKHPVCLVPDRFAERHDLRQVFPDFRLHEWTEAASALQESDQHELYWRSTTQLPASLLVLDTPDIDSDARVNWVRADAVRRSADVLIAVLTQQKYNDAAVKEFFRKAATEDKAVMIVFNQCLLPDDEQYWPIWLSTFCQETGIQPVAVYLAPADRRAADSLELPFYERPWPLPDDWKAPPPDDKAYRRNLSDDLARLKFREVRVRTLKGSLRHLINRSDGVPAWLGRLSATSDELASASERLSSEAVLKIRDWPTPPNSSFVGEIRIWWKSRQQGWSRRINSVYDGIGTGITWPFRIARNALQGEPISAIDKYREREWSAVLTTVEELFDKLQWLAESGNRLVKPQIERVLKAKSRSELITSLKQRHQQIDFESELSDVVDEQMNAFREDSPDMFSFYRQLHNVSAAVRPVTSVVLFSLGFGPAGETVAPFVADAAASAVVHVVADVAGGATAAVAGEAAVSGAAGTGVGMLQAWFHRLHGAFTSRRVEWLTQLIRDELLGTLPEEFQTAASLKQSDAFREVERILDELRLLLDASPGTSGDAGTEEVNV